MWGLTGGALHLRQDALLVHGILDAVSSETLKWLSAPAQEDCWASLPQGAGPIHCLVTRTWHIAKNLFW